MAREGLPFVAVAAGLALVCWLATPHLSALRYGAVVFGILAAFMAFFFRDPARRPPDEPGAIVAAGDGRVMEVAPAAASDYLPEGGTRVSVFLSVFDVHVNRAPISGRVDFVEWHDGQYRPAYRAEASLDNHHTAIGFSDGDRQLVVKQIVGILARRSVCRLDTGDEVARGERFGLIRFGSRVDHILPASAEVRVQVGDRVRGGETVIAVFQAQGA